jgi:hypothetical protein
MNSLTTVPTPVTRDPAGDGACEIATDSYLVLNGQQGHSPHDVFVMALRESILRAGKSVRCTNFVQGISLLLDSVVRPVAGEEPRVLFDFIYASVEAPLKAWLRREPDGEPFCHEILGVTARFAHQSHLEWLPSVLQIDVENPGDIADPEDPAGESTPICAPPSPVFDLVTPDHCPPLDYRPLIRQTKATPAIGQANTDRCTK